MFLAGPRAVLARPDDGATGATPASTPAATQDTLIFRNGNSVTCTILEETETSVKVRIAVAGMSTETAYPKSDILEIKRAPKVEGGAPVPMKPMKAEPSPIAPVAVGAPLAAAASPSDGDAALDKDGKPIAPGTLKVYLVSFGGQFGREVSKTPVQKWMDDVVKAQPDVLVVRFDHSFVEMGSDKIDFAHIGEKNAVYAQLIKAQDIDTLITDRIAGDPAFKVKPRVVAWVNRALGGGAFLPFVFPEIYFTSDGHMGGIGGLDQLFKSTGDEVAQRKQQSLRLSWIVGLCQKGGHDSRIVRAMVWSPYILSYRPSGGQVEWLEDKMPDGPGWFTIKDDGPVKPEHADSDEDKVRMKGNDFLTLNANTAEIIGFSKGTADTADDLLFKMGVTRNYALLKSRASAIFGDWAEQVGKAEQEFDRLWRKHNGVQVRAPAGYQERTAARGEQKKILLQMRSLLDKYAEALDAEKIKDTPENWSKKIDSLIGKLESDQRLDRR